MILIGLFVAIFGMGFAGSAPIRTPLIREYFGTKNFGTIYGLISVFNMISQLAYPPVAGWVYDTLGTYKQIWLIFALGSALGAFLVLTVPLPETLAGQVKQQAGSILGTIKHA